MVPDANAQAKSSGGSKTNTCARDKEANMKKNMITAVLVISMVLGAGSVSYATEKTTSTTFCANTAGQGQTMTAAQLCKVQTAQDFASLCKEQINFEALCKEQLDLENVCKANFDFDKFCQIKTDCKDQNAKQDQKPGNAQNKDDQANKGDQGSKDDQVNKDDRDDSSKDEQVSTGQSSMTSQVVSLVNSERAAQGLTALQSDSELAKIAQQKAEDMAENQYFSHTSPIYGSAFDMLKAAGYSYKSAGENIAMGQKSAASVMDGWMHSSGHRANILDASYEKIGVGYAVSAAGTPYWVQIFAA